MWNNFEIAYEDMYIYNYSSIVEYGTFRRFGRKYFYFSKKHLTDEEFNRFRSRLILADENTCAMLYNEKILDVAKMIKPITAPAAKAVCCLFNLFLIQINIRQSKQRKQIKQLQKVKYLLLLHSHKRNGYTI